LDVRREHLATIGGLTVEHGLDLLQAHPSGLAADDDPDTGYVAPLDMTRSHISTT
jgi:hypothetical protein